jgi:hypothetical protein
MLRPTVQWASPSRCQAPIWGLRPDFYYCQTVALSLTRERVCRLRLLLHPASAIILGSESRGTRDHILLSQIRDSPNLEGQVPVFISPRNRVAQLYHQALGSFFVASYDSQGYGGGIRTCLHAGSLLFFFWMAHGIWCSLYSLGMDLTGNTPFNSYSALWRRYPRGAYRKHRSSIECAIVTLMSCMSCRNLLTALSSFIMSLYLIPNSSSSSLPNALPSFRHTCTGTIIGYSQEIFKAGTSHFPL